MSHSTKGIRAEVAAAPEATDCKLGIQTTLGPKEDAIDEEPVTEGDLVEQRHELWFECGPRRGRPDLALEDLVVIVRPRYLREDSAPRCRGFALEGWRPDGRGLRCEFGRESLEHVANRATKRLREAGTVGDDQLTYYHLTAAPANGNADAETPLPTAAGVRAVVRRAPLVYEERLLAPFLEHSTSQGVDEVRLHYPVFYTDEALARVERIARSGGDRVPAVETGALLVGPLCSCPETGEMFAVVLDAIEAVDADATALSLAFTPATWERVHAVMRARAAHPTTRAHRILGQAHGHNFGPVDAERSCEECEERPTCTKHTAYLSGQDIDWTRATFSGEPWQLGHVFGRDARGGPVDTFYGLFGGVLRARGFHVIPVAEARRLLGPPAARSTSSPSSDPTSHPDSRHQE